MVCIEGGDWFVLKIPRCDTNGMDEYETTVTTERHAQAERTKKQRREEKATSWRGSDKDRARDDGALARGRTARGRERGWPVHMADYLSAQGSGFCARQTKESPHAPELPTPTQAVNLRFDIDGLAQGLEGAVRRGCVRTWRRPQAGLWGGDDDVYDYIGERLKLEG